MKRVMIAVIAIVIGAGGYVLLRGSLDDKTTDSNKGSQTTTDSSSQASPDDGAAQTAAATITYSNDGYSPATVTVKTGDTVVIRNDSSRDMQFDSDPHPAHTDNEELNVGIVEPGKSMSFVVKRTGTFGYHNHLNASDTGTIVVQ